MGWISWVSFSGVTGASELISFFCEVRGQNFDVLSVFFFFFFPLSEFIASVSLYKSLTSCSLGLLSNFLCNTILYQLKTQIKASSQVWRISKCKEVALAFSGWGFGPPRTGGGGGGGRALSELLLCVFSLF